MIDGYGIRMPARAANADDNIPGTVNNCDAVPLHIRDVNAVGFGIDGQPLRARPTGKVAIVVLVCRSKMLRVSSP